MFEICYFTFSQQGALSGGPYYERVFATDRGEALAIFWDGKDHTTNIHTQYVSPVVEEDEE